MLKKYLKIVSGNPANTNSIFIGTSLIALAIAVSAMIIQVYKASVQNPVKILRVK